MQAQLRRYTIPVPRTPGQARHQAPTLTLALLTRALTLALFPSPSSDENAATPYPGRTLALVLALTPLRQGGVHTAAPGGRPIPLLPCGGAAYD